MSKSNLTNRERFFKGDVFLSADKREMYYEEKQGTLGIIMIDGLVCLYIKSVQDEYFTLTMLTVINPYLFELVEFEDLKFIDIISI